MNKKELKAVHGGFIWIGGIPIPTLDDLLKIGKDSVPTGFGTGSINDNGGTCPGIGGPEGPPAQFS